MKTLYRSRTSRYISGVCGGIGEYFNIDPNLVRLGAVLLGLFNIFIAAILYGVAAVILPEE